MRSYAVRRSVSGPHKPLVTLMQQAFRAVKRNRGAAGVDKVSINMFDANREENLAALMRDLKGRTFQPRPLGATSVGVAR